MKVVLSNLAPHEAGLQTGTYGLFRDLTVPFGVAIFVPLFTNRVTSYITSSTVSSPALAAVKSIHILSIVEIVCVLIGIILVQFLPKLYNNRKELK
jgi:hypothetical protein